MWTIRQTTSFIRFAFPDAVRLILSALWNALKLEALSIGALFKGFWPTVRDLAEHWVEDALRNGFPSIWERQLRTTFRILAGLTVISGWLTTLVIGYFIADHAFNWLF